MAAEFGSLGLGHSWLGQVKSRNAQTDGVTIATGNSVDMEGKLHPVTGFGGTLPPKFTRTLR